MPHSWLSEAITEANDGLAQAERIDKKIGRKDLGTVMTCGEAKRVVSSQSAFMSPNPPGTMKDIGLPSAAQYIVSAESTPLNRVGERSTAHAMRNRKDYGDRGEVQIKGVKVESAMGY